MNSESQSPEALHQHQKRWLVITYLVFLAGGALWGLGEEVQLGGGATLGPVMLFAGAAIHLVLRYLVWRRELEVGRIPTTRIARLMRMHRSTPIKESGRRVVFTSAEGFAGTLLLFLFLATDATWVLFFGLVLGSVSAASILYIFYVARLYEGPGID